MTNVGLRCTNCGVWFLMRASEARHRLTVHAPQMAADGPAKREAYEASRRRWRALHPDATAAGGPDTRTF